MPVRRLTTLVILLVSLLPLASCSNSHLGGVFQRSLEADPALTGTASPSLNGLPTPLSTQTPSIAQPADFPAEIPRYPNADLQEVTPTEATPTNGSTPTVSTRWVTADSRDRVLAFYRQQLQTNGWQLQPSTGAADGTIVARQNLLQVTVTVPPSALTSPAPTPLSTSAARTEFVIQYDRGSTIGQNPIPAPQASNDLSKIAFSDSTTVGLSGGGVSPPSTSADTITFTDLTKAPNELQPYLKDVANLGILAPISAGQKSPSTQFEPNKAMTRREYARWLVAANNRLYANRTAQQIRLATNTSQPAFQDVPRTDPDFPAIQGLAEAGLLPSSLSGDSTIVTFRPNAALTRESLLLWKVPIDTRQALPSATIDALKQTWGFQDAARIDPKAQRAVLADFQNSDLSNIRRAFGYTTLFQPKKTVTRAEAAATLWYIGFQGEGQSAQEALKATRSSSSTEQP